MAVIDQRGFSRAANALNLSQPAVSKAVQVLEGDVGVALIERGSRPLRLTDAGASLYERARELFAVEQSAEEEMRALRGLEHGVLRVGASTTIATYLLPSILGAFRAQYPGIALHVVSGNTRTISRSLTRRRLDVALVEGPTDDPQFVVVPWRDDDLVIIAAPTHALGRPGVHVSKAMLAEYPFVSREDGSGTREVAEALLRTHGVHPHVALTLDSTEAVKQAVAAGLGIAVVSRAAAADQLALGRVTAVQIDGIDFPRQLTILRLAGRRPSAPAVAFESLLRD